MDLNEIKRQYNDLKDIYNAPEYKYWAEGTQVGATNKKDMKVCIDEMESYIDFLDKTIGVIRK